MLTYTLQRLLWLIPTLLMMALVTFLVMHATPGSPLDPVAEGANPLSPEAQKNLAEIYGLDKPLPEQFAIFLGKAARGDFGTSFVYKTRTVAEILRETFPVSLLLGALALALAVVGGLALGILAAVGTGSFFVESIFRVPGMGRFFVLSMTGRDYPMIMAVILTYGAFLAVMNLVVDLLYGALDPRIRY